MFPRSLNLLAHFLFRCMTCLKTHVLQSRSTHFHSRQLCNNLCVRGCGDCSDFRVIKCLTQTKLKSICPLCLSHISPCNKLASMPFHYCIKREVSHVHSLKWPLWVTVYITSSVSWNQLQYSPWKHRTTLPGDTTNTKSLRFPLCLE